MDQQEEVYPKPFEYTLSLVGGKWKMHILFWLWHRKVMRYSEIKRVLKNITHKMLSNQLKELQADGLIIRKEYPQVPPKVEYRLTDKGDSLMPVLDAMCKWGHQFVE
ncbi:transcriptional regulator [Clostridium botulinum]|uniref:winged helix-turn-helix transcriptional regulator n=1 Tax=Clostridium botulinum TaxID=1491 RepID=UPI001969FF69|nr:helix-turn-helix domain-containing protein [Clostridium botulinum]MBN3431985.1 transcriptional regulator [Clostridium botulinum]